MELEPRRRKQDFGVRGRAWGHLGNKPTYQE